ncbi:MAG: sulfide/dihydroorotate dehydrogenase-like FAD/NAD-binding protein [Candidatus Coatesbacteria bacterium]|nr:sulfide/dihydroorotate dehydrogenase-like FAD/NAD-binding protein [Candidatus Coatesbacteria bacterium]
MSRILSKERLSENVVKLEMDAPLIARKAKAGQFIIIRIDENGERIPLTIADSNSETGILTIIFQEVGKSTFQLGKKKAGEELADLVGPLGTQSEIENYGTVICVGGGIGIAPIYPITKALKAIGNNVIGIIGARCKNLLFWEDKMREVTDELIVTTDDGSYARKALVTEPLKELMESRKIDRIVAIGPAIMMKFVSLTTKPYNIPTIVSLNTIMVDATGMCGACRCSVDGKTKFACVDGPEFDGHKVDWDEVLKRSQMYREEEKIALKRFERGEA